MNDEQMLELLNTLESGTDLELEIKGVCGTFKMIGKYKGGLVHNGYYKPKSSWSLYESDGYKPCYQFYFQERGKRRLNLMQIGWKVLNIKVI